MTWREVLCCGTWELFALPVVCSPFGILYEAGKSGIKAVFMLCRWSITPLTDMETSFTMLPLPCISIKLMSANWSSTMHIWGFKNYYAGKLHSWRPPPSSGKSNTMDQNTAFVGCLSCRAHSHIYFTGPSTQSLFMSLFPSMYWRGWLYHQVWRSHWVPYMCIASWFKWRFCL